MLLWQNALEEGCLKDRLGAWARPSLLPQYLLDKLQKVQNAAAMLACKVKKSDDIRRILETLYWLPVTHRIQYKISAITLHWLPVTHRIPYKISTICFNSISETAPLYLSDLLQPYTSKKITICIRHPNLCHPSCKHKNIWRKIVFLHWPTCLEQFTLNTPPL